MVDGEDLADVFVFNPWKEERGIDKDCGDECDDEWDIEWVSFYHFYVPIIILLMFLRLSF